MPTFQALRYDGFVDIYHEGDLSSDTTHRTITSVNETTEQDSALLRRLVQQFTARRGSPSVTHIHTWYSNGMWTIRVHTGSRPTRRWVSSRLRTACWLTRRRAQIDFPKRGQ